VKFFHPNNYSLQSLTVSAERISEPNGTLFEPIPNRFEENLLAERVYSALLISDSMNASEVFCMIRVK
jgi:hypothetical protein